MALILLSAAAINVRRRRHVYNPPPAIPASARRVQADPDFRHRREPHGASPRASARFGFGGRFGRADAAGAGTVRVGRQREEALPIAGC